MTKESTAWFKTPEPIIINVLKINRKITGDR